MTWRVTLVHGPDDVLEVTRDSLPQAVEWANAEEVRRGHSMDRLAETFTLDRPGHGLLQYGTNYHYVQFEEVRGGLP